MTRGSIADQRGKEEKKKKGEMESNLMSYF
jgi:hypothetical protein